MCRGRPLRVDDGALSFLVHPLLFSTTEGLPPVTLNWENDEARWVLPDEVAGFDAVPSLVRVNYGDALHRIVLPTVNAG